EGLLLREGLTVTETASAVGALKIVHISLDAFEAAATTATIVPDVPAPGAQTLEGYLYPDTYSVDPKETAEGLVRQIVGECTMKAALQPSATDDLYYVLSSDCVHHSFFKTAAEFNAAAAHQPKC